jgi:peptidoglycan/LPS O-acetylase OafA/YrhL
LRIIRSASKSYLHKLCTKFSRETSSGQFIPQIDGLRFVAIGMVVLFHLNGYLVGKSATYHTAVQFSWMGTFAGVGFHGVELFFVISGFILALPFAAHFLENKPSVNLKKYYLRRVTRLEPPYLLAVIIMFLLAIMVQRESAGILFPHFASSLFYLHSSIYGAMSPVIGVGWSLEIEIQFYLLVPLLTLVFAVRTPWLRRTILSACILGVMAMQSTWIGDSPRISLSILAFLQFFLMGFLLADVFVNDWRRTPLKTYYWDMVALAGWPLLFVTLRSPVLTHWLFPALIFVLYCAAFRGKFCSGFFSMRGITVIGGMCYSIYLIHYEVISLVARFTRNLSEGLPYWVHFLIQLALVGPIILVICGVYFLAIEKPCMRRDWPQRLKNRCNGILSFWKKPESQSVIINPASAHSAD